MAIKTRKGIRDTESPAGESLPRVQRRKLSEYVSDPRNANKGSAAASALLEKSVGAFGPARSGLADKDGVIRAGNHTAEQLYAAGIEDVIEVETDGKAWVVVRRTDMDAAMGREYALFDNRTGQLIEWDADVLAELQADGVDLTSLWDDDQLAALLEEPPDVEFPEYDEDVADDVEYCTCPSCGHRFPT